MKGTDKGQAKITLLIGIALLLLATLVLAYNSSHTIHQEHAEKRLDQRLDVHQLGKAHPSLRTVTESQMTPVILKVTPGSKERLAGHAKNGRVFHSSDDSLLFGELSGDELAEMLADDDALEVWPDLETMAHLDRSAYQVGADVLWNEGLLGENVTIAILDTGVAAEHEMLAGRVVLSADFTGDGAGDAYGHGTHVAGIAAGDGQYRGVAPGARILNGKVLNDYGYGQLSWLINGIDWAVANGADVISLSLGATYAGSAEEQLDSPEVQKVEEAVAAGVTVVIASGNCGNGCGSFTGVTTPGIARNAITVGAVDRENYHLAFSGGAEISDYIKPDVVAPGKDICSSVPWGYECWSGTSMATPHVTGAAALLLRHDSSLSPLEVKSLLEQSSLDLGVVGKDVEYGSGALGLSNILDYAADAPPDEPQEYKLIIPELTAGKEGRIELAFTNLNGEECTKEQKLLCKPRKVRVQMVVEELDMEFASDQTQTLPQDKTRLYGLDFTPLVPGKHRMRVTITESKDVLYNLTATFGVDYQNTTTTMNPVSLVIR